MVHRLTVLQNQDTDDALAARRPRWQWVLIGAGFVLTSFLPLSELGVALGRRLSRSADIHPSSSLRIGLGVLPVGIAFLIAAGGAGALIARFGGARALAMRRYPVPSAERWFWLLAAVGGALSPWLVALSSLSVLVLVGAATAFVTGRIGRTRRA